MGSETLPQPPFDGEARHERDLIDKLNSLTVGERNAVVHLIETLAEEHRQRDRDALEAAIAAARGSWPKTMTVDEIDAEVSAMRAEWDGRP